MSVKRNNFIRLAEARVTKALKAIKVVGLQAVVIRSHEAGRIKLYILKAK
jgi:hypothetical protein